MKDKRGHLAGVRALVWGLGLGTAPFGNRKIKRHSQCGRNGIQTARWKWQVSGLKDGVHRGLKDSAVGHRCINDSRYSQKCVSRGKSRGQTLRNIRRDRMQQ